MTGAEILRTATEELARLAREYPLTGGAEAAVRQGADGRTWLSVTSRKDVSFVALGFALWDPHCEGCVRAAACILRKRCARAGMVALQDIRFPLNETLCECSAAGPAPPPDLPKSILGFPVVPLEGPVPVIPPDAFLPEAARAEGPPCRICGFSREAHKALDAVVCQEFRE